jgi:predicted transcriptional regulator
MTKQSRRTTIYLDPDLHEALCVKAVSISRSLSELVNDAVRAALTDDEEDIAAFDARNRGPLISYDEMVRRLRKGGQI